MIDYIDDVIMSLVYSQGKYFVYHAHSLNLQLNIQSKSTNDDVSLLLKSLNEKVYTVLKHKNLNEGKQTKKNQHQKV